MLNTVTFSADLLHWYDSAAADLPWRRSSNPYLIWLSEIMLQQTQVTAVIPYFQRFTAAFPTVEALAAAPLDRVLKQWEGLGYYSRARNLHRTAQVIAARGSFPWTAAELQQLSGVGRYTANAIASIAFGEAVAVLDGNVIRVLSRLDDLVDDVSKPATQNKLWERATALLNQERPGDHNQAMMELGRMICRPRAPLCLICPVAKHCASFAHNTQGQRPVKPKKARTPHYDVAAGVIWHPSGDGRVLIAQRPAEGLLGSLWEFPGGKQESGETIEQTLIRELQEELAITVEVGNLLTTVDHAFTHFKITLFAFDCQLIKGDPQPIGCADWRWVRLNELEHFAFGKADQQVIALLGRNF
ncbi:MAG: A/G-specific adenine glycosylase [Anaerolineae bacterium]|nr:A/G-specific adenine glycosylase [Anaerolineae bacterium]